MFSPLEMAVIARNIVGLKTHLLSRFKTLPVLGMDSMLRKCGMCPFYSSSELVR